MWNVRISKRKLQVIHMFPLCSTFFVEIYISWVTQRDPWNQWNAHYTTCDVVINRIISMQFLQQAMLKF